MVTQPRTLTVADFMAMPEDGNRHEFVRGEIRSMPPPQSDHGIVEGLVYEAILGYLRDRALSLGWLPTDGPRARFPLVGFLACGEFGIKFALPDDSEQIRGADCVYVPAQQLANLGWNGGAYFPAVPWLVIEVISPSDSASDVVERVQDYLMGGARRVWCLYPRQRSVHIHGPDGRTRVLRGEDRLLDEELLPGFAVPIAWLF